MRRRARSFEARPVAALQRSEWAAVKNYILLCTLRQQGLRLTPRQHQLCCWDERIGMGTTRNTLWTRALEELARMETNSIREFFQETDQHFEKRLSKLQVEAGQERLSSDDDLDWYINLRDEIE